MEREKANGLSGSRAQFLRLSLFFLSALVAAPALADFKMTKAPTPMAKTRISGKPAVSQKQPVLLDADQFDYDGPSDVVAASGNVQVAQGDTVVLADSLLYDRGRDEVTAMGHVKMLEPSGNVYFADALQLKDNMKAGIIHQFKARLADNSLFVANGARRIDDQHMELFKAAYTPCKCLTREGDPTDPTWSMHAEHVLIDQEKQKVFYDNAYMETYGVPVFYTPYFSHPTPGADNVSGLLMPSFIHSDTLGTVYKQPIFYSIAPDKDVTFIPIYTSLEGLVMAGQYRQMFDSGQMALDGSITSAQNIDANGNPIAGREIRGNYNGKGLFNVQQDYDWGFDVHHASDDSYLRRYGFSNDTFLTSRVFGEGSNFIGDSRSRSYGSVQALAFQGLTGQDNHDVVPVVLPLADVRWQSAPGIYNSRFLLNGDAMVLRRQVGADSRRLSGSAGWKLPYISDDGQVIEFNASLRTDVYDVNDVALPDGSKFNGVTGREIPRASMLWRYPFINRFSDNASLMIEPVAELDVSPGGGNPDKIPNEDSLLPEFTDSNLFSDNRFAGLDRVETGLGVSYGVRGQAQLYSDKYIDWLAGQHYRAGGDTTFPFSNDLNSHLSDYVGRVGVTYLPVTLAYRFRLDKETLASNRNELDAGLNVQPVALSASYLSLKNDPVLANKRVVSGSSALALTDNWTWTLAGSRDLELQQMTGATTGLIFKNECVTLTTVVGKDYTTLLDVKPSLNISFTVSLKNLN